LGGGEGGLNKKDEDGYSKAKGKPTPVEIGSKYRGEQGRSQGGWRVGSANQGESPLSGREPRTRRKIARSDTGSNGMKTASRGVEKFGFLKASTTNLKKRGGEKKSGEERKEGGKKKEPPRGNRQDTGK